MTPYRRHGRKRFEMRVPLRSGGDGPIRPCGTEDQEIALEIEALVKRLTKKREYWPLLEAITCSPPILTLVELYDADRANALDDLLASLNDPDLSVYLDGWEEWVNSNLGETGTAAMYRNQIETLEAKDATGKVVYSLTDHFPRSVLTKATVNAWLASRKVTTGYRRKLLYALFSFIRYLREEAVLDRNPIDDITRPKKGKKRTRWETEENDVRIVKAATIEYQGLFAFIKATGAEVSPATELAAREIDLWPEDDERYCGLAHIPGTKTETRDRHDVLIEKWARPFIAAALHGKLPNAKVWAGISRHMAHWHHQKAAAVVEVLDYTLRDARHSWAVRGRKSNPQVTFEAIAEQLGNTVAVVADVYAEYKMTPAERRSGGVSAAKPATKPLRSLRGGKR